MSVSFSCADRSVGSCSLSAPVRVVGLRWEASSRSVVVDCSDGRSRVCRTSRLPVADVRAVVGRLRSVRASGAAVCFAAAGGFSADRWFFNVFLAEHCGNLAASYLDARVGGF